MQPIGPPGVLAPQSLGHPLGLPEDPQKKREITRIKPVNEGTSAAKAQDRPSTKAALAGRDQPLGSDREKPDHTAPPTAMQLKIQAILDEQAEKLEQDALEQAASNYLGGMEYVIAARATGS